MKNVILDHLNILGSDLEKSYGCKLILLEEKDFDSFSESLAIKLNGEPSELQKLEWQNKALKESLQYLVDTKERKDTVGKDSIYYQRRNMGWIKAKRLLKDED